MEKQTIPYKKRSKIQTKDQKPKDKKKCKENNDHHFYSTCQGSDKIINLHT